jgi:hypothetical protein
MTKNDAKKAPLMEAITTLKIAQQLNMYGAPDHVVVESIMTPPDDIYWLTKEDYAAWNVKVI